jgi:N-acetylglutamate synthase-like GNAT family acetyltransferase
MIRLRAATANDRTALAALLAEADMDYTDPPEAYILAVEEGTIAGCGRLEDQGHFVMLRPLVVAEPYRGRGVGRLILQEIMSADKPMVLVARGKAIAFYKAMGFSHTDWNAVPASQIAECESCLNRAECMPQPMIHIPEAYVAPHGAEPERR